MSPALMSIRIEAITRRLRESDLDPATRAELQREVDEAARQSPAVVLGQGDYRREWPARRTGGAE